MKYPSLAGVFFFFFQTLHSYLTAISSTPHQTYFSGHIVLFDKCLWRLRKQEQVVCMCVSQFWLTLTKVHSDEGVYLKSLRPGRRPNTWQREGKRSSILYRSNLPSVVFTTGQPGPSLVKLASNGGDSPAVVARGLRRKTSKRNRHFHFAKRHCVHATRGFSLRSLLSPTCSSRLR